MDYSNSTDQLKDATKLNHLTPSHDNHMAYYSLVDKELAS